jgi:hypothetical protein
MAVGPKGHLGLLLHTDRFEDFTPDEPQELQSVLVGLDPAAGTLTTWWRGSGARQLLCDGRAWWLLVGERVLRRSVGAAPDAWTQAHDGIGSLHALGDRTARGSVGTTLVNLADGTQTPLPCPPTTIGSDEHGAVLLVDRQAVWRQTADGFEQLERPEGRLVTITGLDGGLYGSTEGGQLWSYRRRWKELGRSVHGMHGLARWRASVVVGGGRGLFAWRPGRRPALWPLDPGIPQARLRTDGDYLAVVGSSELFLLDPDGNMVRRSLSELPLQGDWTTVTPWCASRR